MKTSFNLSHRDTFDIQSKLSKVENFILEIFLLVE
jgi:hypothetical protein